MSKKFVFSVVVKSRRKMVFVLGNSTINVMFLVVNYLRLYRRRYKRSREDTHFSNDYDFTLKGVKMVPELGIFLKEEDRRLSG